MLKTVEWIMKQGVQRMENDLLFKIRLRKLQNNIFFQHASLLNLNIRVGVKVINLKNKLFEFCRTTNACQVFPLELTSVYFFKFGL